MKILLIYRSLRPDKNVSALAKRGISKLSGSVDIEAAEVTIERSPASSPPYSARVHLVIPGPDLFAEDKDYTPEASVHKVLTKLSRQIRDRKEKQLAKRREDAEECKPRQSRLEFGKQSPRGRRFY